jgi:hypothetical protein
VVVAPELLKKICVGDAETKLTDPVVGAATVIAVVDVTPDADAVTVSEPWHSVPSDLTEL